MKQPSTQRIRVELRLLSPEEGGRSTAIFSGYRPNWWTGEMQEGMRQYHIAEVALDGVERADPGDVFVAYLLPYLPPDEGFWASLRNDASLEIYEGTKHVGRATVLDPLPEP